MYAMYYPGQITTRINQRSTTVVEHLLLKIVVLFFIPKVPRPIPCASLPTRIQTLQTNRVCLRSITPAAHCNSFPPRTLASLHKLPQLLPQNFNCLLPRRNTHPNNRTPKIHLVCDIRR